MLEHFSEFAQHLKLKTEERFPFLIPKNRGSFQHYLLAIVLMVFALWVRLKIAPVQEGLQYLTFFPAVAIAAIAGGYRAGLLAVMIGIAFATYIFTPPYYTISFEVFRFSLWSNIVFLIDGIIVSFSIEAMHRYRQKYADGLTQAIQVNNSLIESEKKFHLLFETASDCLMLLSMDGRILDINHSGHERLGYTKDEILGKRISELDPPEFASKVPDRITQIMRDGTATFESAHVRKDGSIMPVEINSMLMELNGKKILFSIIRDITERKASEDTLAKSEATLRAILDNSPYLTWLKDPKGHYLKINKVFADYLRLEDIEQAVGKTDLDLQPKELAEKYRADDAEVMASRKQKHVEESAFDGHNIHWVETYKTPIMDKRGNVLGTVGFARDITERKLAEEEIKGLAFYDPLTQLPNRRLLVDRLQQALVSSARSARKGALMFIDLDNFKTLNDTLGHDIGDKLLQHVAQRLASTVREGDSVARMGGDEFVVMLEDLSESTIEAAEHAELMGERILAALNQPYQLAGHDCRSSPSIGATLFEGQKQSTDELMKQADIAMYQAKKAGRNTLRFFDPQMQETINTRVTLENELRNALENRQFLLFYQIQVDSSHRPFGAEALIRWQHPKRGLMNPGEFIPLAEETGLILPMGQWVMEAACAQIKVWERDALTCGLVLSVNVSAKQFHQTDFVTQVKSLVQSYAINPELIKLELTESMMLENIEKMVATMSALKEIGVQFSLDDFGTGYSSLQYLKRLPLYQLNIDRSFVLDISTDSNDRSIVSTIIAMAQSLNIRVIAEGVETEEQRQFLLNQGCTYYQGYLFGKPIPVEQFEELLRRG